MCAFRSPYLDVTLGRLLERLQSGSQILVAPGLQLQDDNDLQDEEMISLVRGNMKIDGDSPFFEQPVLVKAEFCLILKSDSRPSLRTVELRD